MSVKYPQQNIKAIIGLANPGKDYASTRHNAGAWLIDLLCQDSQISLRKENKLYGRHALVTIGGQPVHLLVPETFMNRSGQSIAALCKFYKLAANELLIAHDELDFSAGTNRYKYAGGHGGHNGLRNTIKAIDSADFFRLRIGIGHPGHKDQVADYVLKRPSKEQRDAIEQSLLQVCHSLENAVNGRWQQAMHQLHSH